MNRKIFFSVIIFFSIEPLFAKIKITKEYWIDLHFKNKKIGFYYIFKGIDKSKLGEYLAFSNFFSIEKNLTKKEIYWYTKDKKFHFYIYADSNDSNKGLFNRISRKGNTLIIKSQLGSMLMDMKYENRKNYPISFLEVLDRYVKKSRKNGKMLFIQQTGFFVNPIVIADYKVKNKWQVPRLRKKNFQPIWHRAKYILYLSYTIPTKDSRPKIKRHHLYVFDKDYILLHKSYEIMIQKELDTKEVKFKFVRKNI